MVFRYFLVAFCVTHPDDTRGWSRYANRWHVHCKHIPMISIVHWELVPGEQTWSDWSIRITPKYKRQFFRPAKPSCKINEWLSTHLVNFFVLVASIYKFLYCAWFLPQFDFDILYRFSGKVYISRFVMLVRPIFENCTLLWSVESLERLAHYWFYVFNGSLYSYNLLSKKLSVKRNP